MLIVIVVFNGVSTRLLNKNNYLSNICFATSGFNYMRPKHFFTRATVLVASAVATLLSSENPTYMAGYIIVLGIMSLPPITPIVRRPMSRTPILFHTNRPCPGVPPDEIRF